MRSLSLFALSLLVACSGGGGGGPAPAPVNPNPAPATMPLTSIDMTGAWQVTVRNIVSANTTETNGLQIGAVAEVLPTGTGFMVNATEPPAAIHRQDIEAAIGFSLDWYQNNGDGSFLDFGYGWDRLRVAGGGGAVRDYVQYGVRVVALAPDLLTGYEAEWTQDFLGQPRFEWLAQVILHRQ